MEEEGVHIVSTDELAGFEVERVQGLVWASTVQAKPFLEDLKALLRALWGGPIPEYEALVNAGRQRVLARLNQNAKKLGANAVVGTRMMTAQLLPATVEIIAYGTAVRVRPCTREARA